VSSDDTVTDGSPVDGTPGDGYEPRLDVDRLGRWMDDQGLPGAGEPVAARFITGDASNDLFAITRGECRCVLRRPPDPVPVGRDATMLRENRLLAALADTDVPHPRVVPGSDGPSVVGGCFYLMEFVDGWSPIQEGTTWPESFGADFAARRGLAFELVDGIAPLARVAWKARRLEGFGRPVDEIDYYVILARFKLAIVLEAGNARVVSGEADNPKTALFGDVVLDMAGKAAELAAVTALR
jgi:aminoglycoside phosphotransferase (APT) family kinase protein